MRPLTARGAVAPHRAPGVFARVAARAHGGFKSLDARCFQIAFLLSLLLFGALGRDFALSGAQVLLSFAGAVLAQAFWQFALHLPQRRTLQGYLSALVTACGIAILVRSDTLWVHPLLACLALSSKFVLRVGRGAARGHVFNPANLAAFVASTGLPHAWLSPGQWGEQTLTALWMLALGATVTGRISRWGVSVAFLATWLGLLALRLAWLGFAPELALSVWWHQAMNGATILFAFFMISDPMTTPQHPGARAAYAACVAAAAFAWQFVMFQPQGPIVALFVCSLTVPWWNRVFPAARFDWRG
jgi:Na+-translocating ferredoxin:NAD+ oxidoreductase RnfD subunit